MVSHSKNTTPLSLMWLRLKDPLAAPSHKNPCARHAKRLFCASSASRAEHVHGADLKHLLAETLCAEYQWKQALETFLQRRYGSAPGARLPCSRRQTIVFHSGTVTHATTPPPSPPSSSSSVPGYEKTQVNEYANLSSPVNSLCFVWSSRPLSIPSLDITSRTTLL